MLSTLVVVANQSLLTSIEYVLASEFSALLAPLCAVRTHADALNCVGNLGRVLVLLDIGALGMPGLALIPEIRARNAAARIVVIIGFNLAGYRYAALAAGADAAVWVETLTTELRTMLPMLDVGSIV